MSYIITFKRQIDLSAQNLNNLYTRQSLDAAIEKEFSIDLSYDSYSIEHMTESTVIAEGNTAYSILTFIIKLRKSNTTVI